MVLAGVRAAFWSERVWTPPNATWKLYEDNEYRRFNDIYLSLITAAVLICVRLMLERFVYAPIGVWLGLKPGGDRRQRKAVAIVDEEADSILEAAYKASRGRLTDEDRLQLAKKLDLTDRQVDRWLRRRRASSLSRPTTLAKFTESSWRCSFYLAAFSYGMYVLWDKPWMTDSIWCFVDFPHHRVSSDEWWYYNVESAFYIGLIFSQFTDIQRKDFWAMFVHHVVTLCLLVFSWACNLVRVGTLVLIIHDFADVPLEFAKMMTYVKKQRAADLTFVVFTGCWFVSRLGLLPYRIIYYSSYKALDVVQMFPAYYIFNGLLVALQLLHVVWTWFIVRIMFYAIRNNGIKDLRSDDEESSSEPSDESTADGNCPVMLANGTPSADEPVTSKSQANGGGDRRD